MYDGAVYTCVYDMMVCFVYGRVCKACVSVHGIELCGRIRALLVCVYLVGGCAPFPAPFESQEQAIGVLVNIKIGVRGGNTCIRINLEKLGYITGLSLYMRTHNAIHVIWYFNFIP